jgi:hypothetical protein
MGLIGDLKKLALAKIQERRHRRTVMLLNSLPDELKRDIGWPEAGRRPFDI